MKKYQHLNDKEKTFIRASLFYKKSIREIAKTLNRNVSTISRELKRNSKKGIYLAKTSWRDEWKSKDVVVRKRAADNPIIKEYLIQNIKNKYSPEIISARMFDDIGYRINKDTIYKFVYQTMPELCEYLPRKHKGKMKMRYFQNKNREIIQNRTDIDLRPKEANLRQETGHFEADCIVSKKGSKSALLVVVDRKTRLTRIKKLARKTSEQAANAIIYALKNSNMIKIAKTITYDNGCEFAAHEKINEVIGVKSYFCKPYHSWEKGTVENINGIIRWFFPKKTDFDIITDEQIQQVEDWINNRPMKILNYKSPLEYYNSLTGVAL